MKRFYPFMVVACALPVLFGVHLYKKGHRERQPRPVPVVATPEPVNYLEWRGQMPSQHVPERTFVTF